MDMDDFVRHGDTVLIEACLFAGDCEFVTCTVGRQSVKVKPEQVHPYKPRPKHDHCREFREGDVVRVVDRDGRSWWRLDPSTTITRDGLYTVLEEESEIIAGGYGELRIEGGGREYEIPFYFLELVTPVEEVMPYKVMHTRGFYSVEDKKLDIVASYSCKLHPHAKEAAEAECERLNEEWQTKVCRSEDGKEGNNG